MVFALPRHWPTRCGQTKGFARNYRKLVVAICTEKLTFLVMSGAVRLNWKPKAEIELLPSYCGGGEKHNGKWFRLKPFSCQGVYGYPLLYWQVAFWMVYNILNETHHVLGTDQFFTQAPNNVLQESSGIIFQLFLWKYLAESLRLLTCWTFCFAVFFQNSKGVRFQAVCFCSEAKRISFEAARLSALVGGFKVLFGQPFFASSAHDIPWLVFLEGFQWS